MARRQHFYQAIEIEKYQDNFFKIYVMRKWSITIFMMIYKDFHVTKKNLKYKDLLKNHPYVITKS